MPRLKRHPAELWILIAPYREGIFVKELFRIAEEKGIGHTTFYRLLDELERCGAIEREEIRYPRKLRVKIIPKLPERTDWVWETRYSHLLWRFLTIKSHLEYYKSVFDEIRSQVILSLYNQHFNSNLNSS